MPKPHMDQNVVGLQDANLGYTIGWSHCGPTPHISKQPSPQATIALMETIKGPSPHVSALRFVAGEEGDAMIITTIWPRRPPRLKQLQGPRWQRRWLQRHNNDNDAIGRSNDSVWHSKLQSTNDGSKQMKRWQWWQQAMTIDSGGEGCNDDDCGMRNEDTSTWKQQSTLP